MTAHALTAEQLRANRRIADITAHPHDVGVYFIRDAAPPCDTAQYGGDTSVGTPWDEECDRIIADVRAALPPGWVAEWSDNDIRIERAEEIEAESDFCCDRSCPGCGARECECECGYVD